MESLKTDFKGIFFSTWPIILFITIIIIVLRLFYLKKNNLKINLSKEIPYLLFIIYILCIFQIVTVQDVSGYSGGINITFFKELTRYKIGSRLFYKNIVGNIVLFMPFGFLISYIFKINKKYLILLLVFITSIIIECIQLSIGRCFDVDDVILNVIGGFLGYIIYSLFNRILGNETEHNKERIMTVLMIIIFIAIFIIII